MKILTIFFFLKYFAGFNVVLSETHCVFYFQLSMFHVASVGYPTDFPSIVDFLPELYLHCRCNQLRHGIYSCSKFLQSEGQRKDMHYILDEAPKAKGLRNLEAMQLTANPLTWIAVIRKLPDFNQIVWWCPILYEVNILFSVILINLWYQKLL